MAESEIMQTIKCKIVITMYYIHQSIIQSTKPYTFSQTPQTSKASAVLFVAIHSQPACYSYSPCEQSKRFYQL